MFSVAHLALLVALGGPAIGVTQGQPASTAVFDSAMLSRVAIPDTTQRGSRGGATAPAVEGHQLTIGFQAGGQAYSEGIFFKDDAALENFKEGHLKLGAQDLLGRGDSAETCLDAQP